MVGDPAGSGVGAGERATPQKTEAFFQQPFDDRSEDHAERPQKKKERQLVGRRKMGQRVRWGWAGLPRTEVGW